MQQQHGYMGALEVITKLIIAADHALGGDGDFDRCQVTAANALTSNQHRSFGFLVYALREGMKRRDKDGRAYGKINAQVIHEWTGAVEDEILAMAHSEHARSVQKNDNLGSDWLDRQEHNAGRDKRKIAYLSDKVEELKSKLRTDGE